MGRREGTNRVRLLGVATVAVEIVRRGMAKKRNKQPVLRVLGDRGQTDQNG